MPKTGIKKWTVVMVACMAIFIIVLDSSAMNVAISKLVEDLNTTLSNVQAIIAIYALVIASFMLLGSKLQDILGRRKTFIIGTIIYGFGTLTATFSLNAPMLLLGWAILEGIGAALIFPATTTIISAEYEGKDKLKAFGIWGGIAAVGAAVGPIVGGFFTQYFTWRLVFASELILVIVILFYKSRLSESVPKMKWKDLDLFGAFLSIVSLVLIVFSFLILRSPEQWSRVPLLLIPGVLLFIFFLYWQRRRQKKNLEPLLDISVLKSKLFNLGNINSIIQQIPLAGVLFIMPVFLQQVIKVNAFMTGVALIPLSLAVLIFSLLGGKLLSFFRHPKYIIIIGFLISAIGAYLLRNVFSIYTQIIDTTLGLTIFGVGIGLLLSQLTNSTMNAARKDQEIAASGFLNTSKNLGYSIGTALIGVIMIIGIFNGIINTVNKSNVPSHVNTEKTVSNLENYVEKMQTIELKDVPQDRIPEVTNIVDSSISSAMKQTFTFLAIVMLLGFLAACFMPKQKKGIRNN